MSISDREQTELLNGLYRIDNQTSKKEKTIILYDCYRDEEEEEIALQNLQTCGQVLLHSKLKVEVEKEEGEDTILHRYLPAEEQEVKIKTNVFELAEGKGRGLSNIWIYEMDDCDTRVVTIPINKEMIDISAIRDESQNEKEEN